MPIPKAPGGKRKGSGRKPKQITLLKQIALQEKEKEAEYGLMLFVSVMRDSQQPTELRLDAAKEVMDRVWGKPKQALEHSGPDKGPIEVKAVDYRTAIAALTSGSEPDRTASGENQNA